MIIPHWQKMSDLVSQASSYLAAHTRSLTMGRLTWTLTSGHLESRFWGYVTAYRFDASTALEAVNS